LILFVVVVGFVLWSIDFMCRPNLHCTQIQPLAATWNKTILHTSPQSSDAAADACKLTLISL